MSAAPYPPHASLRSDIAFSPDAADHGVLSASISNDPTSEQHWWITTRAVLPSFETDRRSASYNTFFWTPFSSSSNWQKFRPHAHIEQAIHPITSSSTAPLASDANPISQHPPSQHPPIDANIQPQPSQQSPIDANIQTQQSPPAAPPVPPIIPPSAPPTTPTDFAVIVQQMMAHQASQQAQLLAHFA
jgi:hypothetical protein